MAMSICLREKIARLVAGEVIISYDREMDEIEASLSKEHLQHLASLHNKERVGIKDQYKVWLKIPTQELDSTDSGDQMEEI